MSDWLSTVMPRLSPTATVLMTACYVCCMHGFVCILCTYVCCHQIMLFICLYFRVRMYAYKSLSLLLQLFRDFFRLSLWLKRAKVSRRDVMQPQNFSCRMWRSSMQWYVRIFNVMKAWTIYLSFRKLGRHSHTSTYRCWQWLLYYIWTTQWLEDIS